MCIFIVSLYIRKGMCACAFKDTSVDDIEENYEHDFLSKVGFISQLKASQGMAMA